MHGRHIIMLDADERPHRRGLPRRPADLFMRPGTAGMRGLWSAASNGRDERKLGDIGPFRLPDVSFDVSPNDQIVWPAFHAGTPEIWMATLR
jgi:hypothetical protein